MCINRWSLTFTVANLVVLMINSPIARGEIKYMNQEDCSAQRPSNNVQHKISEQTQREVLDYWTPERMQNAKPIMPTVPETPDLVPQSDVEERLSPSISAPGSAPLEQT